MLRISIHLLEKGKFPSCPERGICYVRESMKKLTMWLGLIALLVLLAVFPWLLSGRDAHSTDLNEQRESARRKTSEPQFAREQSSRRQAFSQNQSGAFITTHQPEQLKDFVLRECQGRQVSLRTALKIIDEAYLDACYCSADTPLKLKYVIDGSSDKLLTFSLKGKKWLDAVEYVAALAGMKVDRNGQIVTLSALPAALQPKKIHVDVSPDLLEMLEKSLVDLDVVHENVASNLGGKAYRLFREHGIIDGAQIHYDEEAGILTLNGSEQECNALERLMAIHARKPKDISISTTLIKSETPLDLLGGNLDKAKVHEWLSDLNTRDGIEIQPMPSTLMRSGTTGVVEMKSEDRGSWLGVESQYAPELIGLKITSSSQTEFRPDQEGAEHQNLDAQFLVSSGDTQIKSFGNDSVAYYYQASSFRLVDSNILGGSILMPVFSTRSIGIEGNNPSVPPVAMPVPGKPGFVFSPYNNNIVDVEGLKSGLLVADPFFPSDEKKHFRVP
jgi:hypothetical protein